MNAIHDYAEPLTGGRAQLRRDIVICGQVVISHDIGSPAPAEVVAEHERHVDLDYEPKCSCGGIDLERDAVTRVRRCQDCGAVIR